jgi:DNA-binding response OmpR family regulator
MDIPRRAGELVAAGAALSLPSQAVRIAMPDPPRVAVLDESPVFAAALGAELERWGWKVGALDEPPTPWALARMRLHALVLDTAVLGGEPLRWIEQIGREMPEMRIVVCARFSTVEQRVSALRSGVDDWIAKPCDMEEIAARVESTVRGPHHVGPVLDERPLVEAELTISPNHRQAFAHGVSARLTRREFGLLHLLAGQPGCVVDRASAYLHVWGYPMVRRDRSVDVHVRRIRSKLKRVSPEWSYIQTHYQVGYRFRATRDEVPDSASAQRRAEALAV